MTATTERFKPPIKIIGGDSNAFAILGAANRALKKAERDGDLPEGTAAEYQADATSGDYNQLLATTAEYCEIE